MSINDTCTVGVIKAGMDYDPHWEVFETGDSEVARAMWRKLHGDASDDELHSYPYNAAEIAACYGLDEAMQERDNAWREASS